MERADRRIMEVAGARRGHGATTVAVLLSWALGVGLKSREPSQLCSALGERSRFRSRGPQVVDVGSIDELSTQAVCRVGVLRGPDFAGVKALIDHNVGLDALILVREPWRSLTEADVAASTGMRVDACLGFSPEIAQMTDAGVLGRSALRLAAAHGLAEWARDSLMPLVVDHSDVTGR